MTSHSDAELLRDLATATEQTAHALVEVLEASEVLVNHVLHTNEQLDDTRLAVNVFATLIDGIRGRALDHHVIEDIDGRHGAGRLAAGVRLRAAARALAAFGRTTEPPRRVPA